VRYQRRSFVWRSGFAWHRNPSAEGAQLKPETPVSTAGKGREEKVQHMQWIDVECNKEEEDGDEKDGERLENGGCRKM
jgi:hypothetical protein